MMLTTMMNPAQLSIKNKMFWLLCLLSSLSMFTLLPISQVQAEPPAQQDEAQVIEFLTLFESATLTHDRVALIKLFDTQYVREQHDQFLKGNTEQFLNEFFCGERVIDQKFHCGKFNQVFELQRIKLVAQDQTHWKVVYRFTDRSHRLSQTGNHKEIIADIPLTLEFEIKVQVNDQGKKVYGILGAVG